MQEFYKIFKEIVEILYYFSSIGLLIGVIVGLKQLKLTKKDFQVSNQRASIEKSIEYLNLFATEFIPLLEKYYEKMEEQKLQNYKGPKNKEFRFDKNCNLNSKYIADYYKAAVACEASELVNRFEFFSAAIVSGLADENLAFTPLAETFCEFIDESYIVLCFARQDETSNLYENTIKLYNIWSSKLEKNKLAKRKSKLDEEMSKIPDHKINYIGQE